MQIFTQIDHLFPFNTISYTLNLLKIIPTSEHKLHTNLPNNLQTLQTYCENCSK